MKVAENYKKITEHINEIAVKCGRNPNEIQLLAVSKGYSWGQISPAYDLGCRHFGESRVQEALVKMGEAPNDVQWHLIGPLQKNKVRKCIGKFQIIHSVDSVELAKKISECSREEKTNILLEANTSGEASKHGLTPNEWKNVINDVIKLPGITILGLMTIAPLVEDEGIIRNCFAGLRILRDDLVKIMGLPLPHLSMGMSHDYPLAIMEGATILRVGTAIFKG